MNTPPSSVVVREVGLRDGLQILPRVLATAYKLDWLPTTPACARSRSARSCRPS
jgi:hypothetical protein